ncbi:tetratricopeptide repeat protein [Nonomuraea maritima]|uniref:tetratricopeptide repeat protein n=1 Tax=Nonomuraea maritima TaxID=683260 RepID=UPI00371EEE51
MASEQLDAAMDHWRAGDLDTAAALFREIAATGDPEASHLLAGLLHEQGDLDGAEAAHRSVVQSGDPVFGQRSAMAMGMMFIHAKEWPAAHRVLSIASDGADFEVAALADTALVLVCSQLGDARAAREALERARRCDSPAVAELSARLELPDFPDERVPAHDRYAAAEDEDDFLALLTCGDPEVVALASFRLHRMYADAGRFAAAREVLEHAVAAGDEGHRAEAYGLLGAVLAELGEDGEAAAAYRVAAEDPRPGVRLPALVELAEVTARLGGEGEAWSLLRRVVASGHAEHAVRARAVLARMQAETGEAAAALASVRAVLEAADGTWAPGCVALLARLLERAPDARDEIAELARTAARHPARDAAFLGALLLGHDALRPPPDAPAEGPALPDVDAGLERFRSGDLDGARRLLRRAADAGAPVQAPRAMLALAELEIGAGDREQAEELLTYVAEGDDVAQGFQAAFLLHLLRLSGEQPHPVLGALLDRRRLGREEWLARHRAVARHPDPAVSAIGAAVCGHVLASSGYDLPGAAAMLRAAADDGDPLALSYAAVACKDAPGEASALLRRAGQDGHPALAPWVAYLLGGLVATGEAREAYGPALEAGSRGLRVAAATELAARYEREGDLAAACPMYERLAAEGEPALGALALALVRLDDLEGARAACARDSGAVAAFGALLLDRDFAGAAQAFPAGDATATAFALECAYAWHRAGDAPATAHTLTLLAPVAPSRTEPPAEQPVAPLAPGDRARTWSPAALLAGLLEERGDVVGARRVLGEAAAGGDLACRRRLLVHLLVQGDLDAVVAEAERAVAGGDPETTATGYRTWGAARRASGDLEEAARLFRSGVAVGFPGATPGLRVELARVLRELGDHAGADREIRLAVESDDPAAVAGGGVLLGGWLREEGDLHGAARAFAAAAGAGVGGTALDDLDALAREACLRGDHGLALDVLDLLGTHLRAGVAGLAVELGDMCADPAAVRRYYELAGTDPFTELRAAERLEELGETAQARAVYARLSDHEDADVRFVATGALAAQPVIPAPPVIPVASIIQPVVPTTPVAQPVTPGAPVAVIVPEAAVSGEGAFDRAGDLLGGGRVEEARRVYLGLVDGPDGDLAVRAMIALGRTHHDEDADRARAWYLRAVEEGGGHEGAMHLGALAERDHDFPEALTWYQRVIDAGGEQAGSAAAHLGGLCYHLGDRDGALRYYELTLGLTEQGDLVAEAACRLGEIRYERGDLEAARHLLRRAAATGDATFATAATALLARLHP